MSIKTIIIAVIAVIYAASLICLIVGLHNAYTPKCSEKDGME